MRNNIFLNFLIFSFLFLPAGCDTETARDEEYFTMTTDMLKDKIMGAWALQTIGVTYGGPTEFRYNKRIIPDSIGIPWTDTTLYHWMTRIPGLYDDIYMDLTFVDVLEKEGMDAPASAFGTAYATAEYWLWHANQQGRYNILHGIMPPESGHWLHNPHADDIDFQIEADFAGIMNPGMPNSASEVCDRVGHVMNSGDGYYGGVYVAAMYSNAFIMDDVKDVVARSLEVIPTQSTFYQCVADVILWHEQYPVDWKKTWALVEEKWGNDIGCPDGAFSDFNIDAKINAAYVVMGMLYGNGDLDATLDISTRCGQDSDCNPATAAGVLGTMMGYEAIPEKWAAGLKPIEDMDFKFTTVSLNDAYGLSYRHALQMIEANGGDVSEGEVKIKIQEPHPVPLEQNFPGYKLSRNIDIGKQISTSDTQEIEIEFEGIGIVLRGRVLNRNFQDVYALQTAEQTLNGYALETDFYIDGELMITNLQPLDFIERNHELFYAYELEQGAHVLKMVIKNPHPDVVVNINNAITYTK